MSETPAKVSRRQQILETLAFMLESHPGRITTAALAAEVGVSEAALYRHFPSKTKMYEGLIEFMEEAIFTRINQYTKSQQPSLSILYDTITLVLVFAERNPGFCRLLTGEAIAVENERLRSRIAKLFDRLETEIKQLIKQAEIKESLRPQILVSDQANFVVALISGKVAQYVRSNFKQKPTSAWENQWHFLAADFFKPAS